MDRSRPGSSMTPSFPKQGRHSVGVARQYCGQLGKEDNCQVAVSLSLANAHASLPVSYRLYLPQEWTSDRARLQKAGVPADIGFQTKHEIALASATMGLRGRAAARRGADGRRLWQQQRFAGRHHGAGIDLCCRHSVEHHRVGSRHRAAAGKGSGRAADDRRSCCGGTRSIGRSRSRHSRSACPSALGARSNGEKARPRACRSRFARVRICVARRDFKRSESRPQEWLLIEWPKGETEPTKYWLSTLPDDITLRHLVYFAKLRWRIERDYQELKQEVGLGHFEGRGWRGFHHHATLCIAAYGFLISEREAIPPSGSRSTGSFAASMLPRGYRPRGSAAAAQNGTFQTRLPRCADG